MFINMILCLSQNHAIALMKYFARLVYISSFAGEASTYTQIWNLIGFAFSGAASHNYRDTNGSKWCPGEKIQAHVSLGSIRKFFA